MNISGVLVRARPERVDAVLASLREIEGVDIHAVEPTAGRIVVTVEDGAGYCLEDSLHRLYGLEGISDAALVYQYSDDSLSKEAQA